MKINLKIENDIIVEYQTVPLVEETAIEITDEQFLLLEQYVGCLDKDFNIVQDLIDKKRMIQAKKSRIFMLKKFLSNSDYKVMKYMEGQLSSQEFQPTKILRQSWRNEINRLEQEIAEVIE